MAYIWHISSVHFKTQTIVSGIILQGSSSHNYVSSGILRNAIHTISHYFKNPYSNQSIQIKVDKKVIETQTDQNGGFSISIAKEIKNDIFICTSDQKEIKLIQNYPVFFKYSNVDQLVISDIDDTIMRSYTKTNLKRLLTTVFYRGHRRQLIKSTHGIYQRLMKKNSSFFYVSKSEFNLVRLIAEFLMHHNLPLGPLLLTPFLSLPELFSNAKDSAFKYKSICAILELSEKVPVVLIGDDTQADMEVYTQIIKKYGAQISKVYIRQTNNHRSPKQNQYWKSLNETGVEAMYFNYKDL